MGVLHPVKLVITNYPAGKSETFEVENNPTDPSAGTHEITFSRECWIEADDFMAEPIPKYKRLFPGGRVPPEGRISDQVRWLRNGRKRQCDRDRR